MFKTCVLCGSNEANCLGTKLEPLCQGCFQKLDCCAFCNAAILPGSEEPGHKGNGRCASCAAEGCTEEDL